MIDEKLWKLWKEYRAGPPWCNEPEGFKAWVEVRENRKRIDWNDHWRNDVIKQATLKVDGFRVVVKVRHDEISNCHDADCYGSYDDSPNDHYAIDRLKGEAAPYHSRDARKRYYNMPRGAAYADQRDRWLEVCKLEAVLVRQAEGRRLAADYADFKKGHKLTTEDVKSLIASDYSAVLVDGRMVRRCRYGGVFTKSKSNDDLTVRENIRKSKEILDDWYEDRWYFYDVYATAYMGDVELGSAGCIGFDSINDAYMDERAIEIAEEAAYNARKEFEEIRGTADTRCELIADISKTAESANISNEEGLDAWLGFLYACIAKGEALDTEEAPLCFGEFFDKNPKLAERARLYMNRLED